MMARGREADDEALTFALPSRAVRLQAAVQSYAVRIAQMAAAMSVA